MKEIARTTVGRQAANPKCVYPIVRLPKNDGNLIGRHVVLYESSHDGARAFLIVLEESAAQPIAQPPCVETSQDAVHTRLNELEKRIRDVEGRCSDFPHATPTIGGVAYPDGPAEIRTQDLRHVKATS